MSDYWFVEIPDAKQRLAEADLILQRDCRELLREFIYHDGHWDDYHTAKGLIWALIGSAILYAAIWGIFAL